MQTEKYPFGKKSQQFHETIEESTTPTMYFNSEEEFEEWLGIDDQAMETNFDKIFE